MLTYSFSDIGPDSLYEYLYKCIKMKTECDEKDGTNQSFLWIMYKKESGI